MSQAVVRLPKTAGGRLGTMSTSTRAFAPPRDRYHRRPPRLGLHPSFSARSQENRRHLARQSAFHAGPGIANPTAVQSPMRSHPDAVFDVRRRITALDRPAGGRTRACFLRGSNCRPCTSPAPQAQASRSSPRPAETCGVAFLIAYRQFHSSSRDRRRGPWRSCQELALLKPKVQPIAPSRDSQRKGK